MEADAWVVEEVTTSAGRSRLREFIEGLTLEDKEEAAALIRALSVRGNRMREPDSKSLGQGLFELRGAQVRIFYTFRSGRRIILLGGLVKKRGNIPAAVLGHMRKLAKEVN